MRRMMLITAMFAGIAAHAQTFTLKSNELGGQATSKQVFNGFGCNGENKSPQLFWENAPKGTKSFAVTIFDEDAPTGSGWWHWLIFDIATSVKELKPGAGNVKSEAAPKNAIQSKTDFGTPGYSGPCPPAGSGFHKYTITAYALDVKNLGLDANANPALVGFTLNQHLIQKASMIMYFKK
ncbi:YbhB/YbcL family Raf kinase inhibitor-like protein [Niabella sp. 22666]|uniref:YbhB/YbcL family Raf kinase inhibitor-like protein n=1 Tax=Niabella sp. 22666 TaxID=3453954 RepID=UPI003F86D024